MTLFRASISFPMDTALPRDEMSIHPHYDGTDAAALAASLKTNLIANANVGATQPFKIKIYDAKKAPPSYPLATAEQTGTPKGTSGPREVAICLSYYAVYSRPGFRGRVYLNPTWIGGGTLGQRPSPSQRTSALGWKSTLGAGLPPSCFWIVYSRKSGLGAQVTNVWVDDEWDTVRSRGLRGTVRDVGTVP